MPLTRVPAAGRHSGRLRTTCPQEPGKVQRGWLGEPGAPSPPSKVLISPALRTVSETPSTATCHCLVGVGLRAAEQPRACSARAPPVPLPQRRAVRHASLRTAGRGLFPGSGRFSPMLSPGAHPLPFFKPLTHPLDISPVFPPASSSCSTFHNQRVTGTPLSPPKGHRTPQ